MNCPGADELNAFFESQLAEWEFARRNFEALRRIETKTFDLDGFSIRVQFNPAPDRFVGRKGRCGVRRCPKMFFMSGKSTARTAGITLGGRLSGIGKSVSDFRPAFYDPCGGTRAAVDRGSLWGYAGFGALLRPGGRLLQRPAVRSLGSRPCSFSGGRQRRDAVGGRNRTFCDRKGSRSVRGGGVCDPRLPARRIRDPFRPMRRLRPPASGNCTRHWRYCRRMWNR